MTGGGGLALAADGGLISVDWKDAQLTDALRLVARVGNLNLVLDPSVAGKTVTLALHDVPWQQALQLICSTNGFGSEIEGNVLRVAPVSKLTAENQQLAQLQEARALSAPLATIAFPLSWTDATAAEALVRKQLSSRGTTMVDRRTNTLFVTDVMGSPALQGAPMQTAFFQGITIVPSGPGPAVSQPVRVSIVGPVTEAVVGIRAVAAPGGTTPSAEWMDVPVGRRGSLPGVPGLELGIEQDGSRSVLVARAGRAGAQVPAVGRQAFALRLASGAEALLITEVATD
jgi:hypothetical protein